MVQLFASPLKCLEELVKEKVAKECGVDKDQLPRVEYRPLPFIVARTKQGRVVLGKIAGIYNTLTHKIYIDPIVYFFSSLYGRIKLLAEEFYHAADNLKGKLKLKYKSFSDYLENYHKDEDERRAKAGAEKIAGEILNSYSLSEFSYIL